MNQRLGHFMNKLVSPNQTCFIKVRSITENIMLTQDMVNNITRPSPHGNIVIKLDMIKAYDRVSWEYLCKILKHFGFLKKWIDGVCRLINNIWYLVNIKGVRHRFFNSSKSIKQGDPLSPLFVLGAELFTKMMDSLIHTNFVPFAADNNGPNISHLFYAMILFCSPHTILSQSDS